MTADFEVVRSELGIQRQYLDVGVGTVGSVLETVHNADTGVQAPHGRTSLRELLEGAIGETHALIEVAKADVQSLSWRISDLGYQVEELDVRLGSGWETL
ncbi:hypothetical protein [Microbacterium sp. MYb64]|uniref:hypothetical protein n=1 Tax=Microbacterium sp. MYb64 TaxID=1848691 RepID=UPI000CFB0A22|nr:hypothetical protein [Microbacterium sp. MYb64]PRB04324.1 hypothetical protein CQ044_12200 [Microbacterium sp. MYb64]